MSASLCISIYICLSIIVYRGTYKHTHAHTKAKTYNMFLKGLHFRQMAYYKPDIHISLHTHACRGLSPESLFPCKTVSSLLFGPLQKRYKKGCIATV